MVWQSERVAHASRIILLRHGQTDFNVEGRFQGVSDLPLNRLGYVQAGRAGAVITRRLSGPGESVGVWADDAAAGGVRVVSSPLLRARETAGRAAHQLAGHGRLMGDEGDGGVAVTIDRRLIERTYGVFEGRTVPEIREEWPEAYAQWRLTGECPEAGIESSRDVGARVSEAVLEWAYRLPEDQTLLVVSHGTAITRGLVALLGLDPGAFTGLRGLDNCHWSELVPNTKGSGWRLAAHNVGAREDMIGG